jgi:hypothetical protein
MITIYEIVKNYFEDKKAEMVFEHLKQAGVIPNDWIYPKRTYGESDFESWRDILKSPIS